MGAVVECYPPRVDEVAVLPLNSLPLGFRFRPTDEELIDYYLRQKINGNGDDVWVIREIDVCKWEPSDLPDLSVIRNKDPEWFFFCPQDRKYPNGHRLNRATTHGYWKATGKDRKIKSGSSLIGMKKTLVFYTGRAPRGKRTNWVMHEYRPTLKELDGTNPGQSPYVLCRLFKKRDETLEGSNCDEVDWTVSTPTAANYSPEEIQSGLAPIAASPSLATEDKNRAVPFGISENSEDVTSNILMPIEYNGEECDTCDVKNKIVIPTTAEEDQLLNLDIFYDPTNELLDDRLFSPVHVHIPPEFYFPANNESDNHCELQHQYGMNEVSEFLNSVVNWDELSHDSSCQKSTSTLIDVKDNGSGSDSDVEMSNIPSLQAFHAAYPEEAIDGRASLKLETSPQFYGTTTSGLIGDEQKSNTELLQNNSLIASSHDVGMGEVYNVVNGYAESRNYNAVVSGDNGTGIKRRTRQERNDLPNKIPADQGTAPRRIRLQRKLQVQPINSNEMVKDGSCTRDDHDSKPIVSRETRTSENHAIDPKVVDEPQKTSPESIDITKISLQHAASACSISKLRDFLLCARVRYTSKAPSKRTMWSSVLVFSVVVLVLLIFLSNIWGYLKF